MIKIKRSEKIGKQNCTINYPDSRMHTLSEICNKYMSHYHDCTINIRHFDYTMNH